MEKFWFFWLRFRHAYDSAYDSDLWFSLGHKALLSYDSDSYSVASENHPLARKMPHSARQSDNKETFYYKTHGKDV